MKGYTMYQGVIYEFSIIDSNNFSKGYIENMALSAAQSEFSLLGIYENPIVTLVSESIENGQKIYHFVATEV